jgi:sugar phosphate isomerase/epimerase
MQLGIRLHDTVKCSIEERLEIAKDQGFSCAHIALGKLCDMPFQNDALTPGYAMFLKSIFNDVDIDIAVLGNYLNLANPDKNQLKEIQRRYMNHIRFASFLGCGMVGTETGAPNIDYHYDKEACRSDEALDILENNLRPVVRYAENMGVIIAIEPVYRHIVWNPKRARELLDRIDSPNLQIIFDPVNLLDVENVDRRDEIFQEAFDLLASDIAMVHLKDYVIKDGELKSVGCGYGEMDYTEIIRFLEQRKPYIHATLEETTPDTAVYSRKYIEDIIRKVNQDPK